jgi:hypothetical protein
MPRLEGGRAFALIKEQDTDNKQEFDDYLARRIGRDRDAWVVELDIADAERFIAELTR